MQPLAAHVNWGTSGQWKMHQAEECSSSPVPSLPRPALTLSSVDVAGLQLLGTPAPSLILHIRQRLCCAGTGCVNHHVWKAQR